MIYVLYSRSASGPRRAFFGFTFTLPYPYPPEGEVSGGKEVYYV